MSLITMDYYSAQELADLQDVHLKTVYRWVKRGVAPGHETFAGMHWFKKTAADKWQKPKAGRGKS